MFLFSVVLNVIWIHCTLLNTDLKTLWNPEAVYDYTHFSYSKSPHIISQTPLEILAFLWASLLSHSCFCSCVECFLPLWKSKALLRAQLWETSETLTLVPLTPFQLLCLLNQSTLIVLCFVYTSVVHSVRILFGALSRKLERTACLLMWSRHLPISVPEVSHLKPEVNLLWS